MWGFGFALPSVTVWLADAVTGKVHWYLDLKLARRALCLKSVRGDSFSARCCALSSWIWTLATTCYVCARVGRCVCPEWMCCLDQLALRVLPYLRKRSKAKEEIKFTITCFGKGNTKSNTTANNLPSHGQKI